MGENVIVLLVFLPVAGGAAEMSLALSGLTASRPNFAQRASLASSTCNGVTLTANWLTLIKCALLRARRN